MAKNRLFTALLLVVFGELGVEIVVVVGVLLVFVGGRSNDCRRGTSG